MLVSEKAEKVETCKREENKEVHVGQKRLLSCLKPQLAFASGFKAFPGTSVHLCPVKSHIFMRWLNLALTPAIMWLSF